jgi:hypothetical protein
LSEGSGRYLTFEKEGKFDKYSSNNGRSEGIQRREKENPRIEENRKFVGEAACRRNALNQHRGLKFRRKS